MDICIIASITSKKVAGMVAAASALLAASVVTKAVADKQKKNA